MVTVEPIHGLLHRRCDQFARHGSAGFPAHDQPGVGEHREVLHHRGQRHGKRPGELADRQVALAEPRQERTPGGVGERREGAVERGVGGGLSILNHWVKY